MPRWYIKGGKVARDLGSQSSALTGCCSTGCSAVGVIIYDRMLPSEPARDRHQEYDTQELRSICITRSMRVHRDRAADRGNSRASAVLTFCLL